MGLSTLGKHDLTQAQFDKLSQYYINKAKPDQVLWKDFQKDIESGECLFYVRLCINIELFEHVASFRDVYSKEC